MLAFGVAGHAAEHRLLRVCADPNNLPFSNQQEQGFENRIADIVASELGATVEYTWWSMRRGFVRNALNEGKCDVVMSMPADSDMVLATKPYYRSTYVFASRADRSLHVTSLNDDRLTKWKIGVHLVGNNLAPPASALAARGITSNIVPFSLFGALGQPNPPSKLIDAVVHGDVDIAILWGPFAGYFARVSRVPIDVVPVSPSSWRSLPFTFNISAAVRKSDESLRAELDNALDHQCAAIQAVLSEFAVPAPAEGQARCATSH